ncbi:hypothetical protein ACIBSV_02465 [Embleya sp. NPDC050154]|uniref:hypothetical protein n=1 Tax=Embleya sp. NPDC050154 TaxID=3363988 RepID=UPI0037B8422F
MNREALYGLAANPALPAELLDRLIAVADEDLACGIAGNAALTPAQATALVERQPGSAVALVYAGRLGAADIDPTTRPDVALALLDQGAGPPEWARLFAADPDAEHRERLAACPDLPSDVRASLAADPEVRVAAELGWWTTTETATRLAEHPHADVRRAVAANDATPPALLAALLTGNGLPPARRCAACDREPVPFVHDPHFPRLDCELPSGAACSGAHESTVHEIQHNALGNRATPTEAVAGFVDHPSMLLRAELAARGDLSPEQTARLAEDPIPLVRLALAENFHLDEAACRMLADDGSHDVRRVLAANPGLPLDALTRVAGTTRLGPTLLPRIATASPTEIAAAAASADAALRMLVAARRDLPDTIRDTLAGDPDAKVVASIAPHPGLSEARLRAMLARHGARVAAGVAANPDASSALLEELTRQPAPPRKALRAIARHRNATAPALHACLVDDRARRLAAGHPALSPATLIALLADEDAQVVQAAAAHPMLPVAVMAEAVSRAEGRGWAVGAGGAPHVGGAAR